MRIQLLIIILLTTLVYSNIFQNNFLGDDEIFIKGWDQKYILANLPEIFSKEIIPGGHQGAFRPLRTVFFAMIYQVWGTNTYGHHLDSLFLHVIATILIYFIARELVMGSGFGVRGSGTNHQLPVSGSERTHNYLPFLTALLFGLHPVHTDAVTLMAGVIDLLGIVFFLASFLFYLKARNFFPKLTPLYFLSLFLAFIAFFDYEITLILPFVILLYEFCFHRKNSNWLKSSPYLILILTYIFWRMAVLKVAFRGSYFDDSFYLTMLTMTKAFMKYISLMILPVELSIDPTVADGIGSFISPLTDMSKIRSQSIFNLDILFNISVITSLILTLFLCLKKNPLISFSIGFFFLALVPVSNMIPIGAIMQERYSYLASFGFVLLISHLGGVIISTSPPKWKKLVSLVFLTGFLLIVTFYGIRTFMRNKDWKDGITMWSKVVRQHPDDPLQAYFLASIYERENQPSKALEYYQKVVILEPRIPEIYYRIGKIYDDSGNRREAVKNYLQTLSQTSHHGAKNALGRIYQTHATLSAYLVNKDFVEASLDDTGLFFYRKELYLKPIFRGIILNSKDGKFTLKLEYSYHAKNESVENYIASNLPLSGESINEGQAKIPNFDYAYVKAWKDNKLTKMQFFLFKGDLVIKALIYPADSDQLRIFDEIIATLFIND